MSIIGPRPQLVRDMVFMDKEQRKRHSAKGANDLLKKLNPKDRSYIESFSSDKNFIAGLLNRAHLNYWYRMPGLNAIGILSFTDDGNFVCSGILTCFNFYCVVFSFDCFSSFILNYNLWLLFLTSVSYSLLCKSSLDPQGRFPPRRL